MANAITWFEIPSVDFDRAVAFYSEILGTSIRKELFMGIPNGMFTTAEGEVGGAIVHNDSKPSTSGTLVYLNAGNQIDAILERVGPAGGTVVLPSTSIGPQGWMAIIMDTEGNQVGLHSPAR